MPSIFGTLPKWELSNLLARTSYLTESRTLRLLGARRSRWPAGPHRQPGHPAAMCIDHTAGRMAEHPTPAARQGTNPGRTIQDGVPESRRCPCFALPENGAKQPRVGQSTRWPVGWKARDQSGDRSLGCAQVLPAPAQRRLQIGQLGSQGRASASVHLVADIGAAPWPDLHQALRREDPDGDLHGVQRHLVLVPERAVRRQPGSSRVRAARNPSPHDISDLQARTPVALLGHEPSLAICLKTERPPGIPIDRLSQYNLIVLRQKPRYLAVPQPDRKSTRL